MRKIVLYSAVSLDGYIARKDGNIDWLNEKQYTIKNEDYGYHKFYSNIDTTLMGYKTLELVLRFKGSFPYEGKQNFVFTTQPRNPHKHVQYVSENIVPFIEDLKTQQGKNIWLVGGGQLNSLLIEYQLVDELILTIFPLILGNGIPLFPGIIPESKYQLINNTSYNNGLIQVHYSLLDIA